MVRDVVLRGDGVDLFLDERGQDPARTDGVAGDAVPSVFQRDDFRHADDAVLGGDVGDFSRAGDEAVGGRDVNDAPPAFAFHQGNGATNCVKGRGQIRADYGVPFFQGKVLDGRDELDSGVVHDNIDRTEGFVSRVHHGVDFGGFRDIAAVIFDLHAEGGDFAFQLRDGFSVREAVEHDVRALLCEFARDAPADAAGGTCDDGGFSFEHGGEPFRIRELSSVYPFC